MSCPASRQPHVKEVCHKKHEKAQKAFAPILRTLSCFLWPISFSEMIGRLREFGFIQFEARRLTLNANARAEP